MRLPGVERSHVDGAKVRDYLLSRVHPIGRFKAAFFETLGYSRVEWRALERDLRALAASEDATLSGEREYGRKYVVRGMLRGPAGRSAPVVTVWVILLGEDFPRLVTAYPGGEP
ncbi:MAG TPA: hypothetical protein VFI25_03240 [Planctomycetota bacterium]|jgi:hypothetical protein|nr:hypothetical protein [Planctomycetota bacterium]